MRGRILSACAENKTVSSGSETAQPIQNGMKETAEGMPESESPGNTLHAEETAGGTLVVYFSATGTTRELRRKSLPSPQRIFMKLSRQSHIRERI